MVFYINLVQLCVSATDPGTDTRCTEDPKIGARHKGGVGWSPVAMAESRAANLEGLNPTRLREVYFLFR